MNICTSSTD